MKVHQKKILNEYLDKGSVTQNTDSFFNDEYLYETN
jgi:hypothetical protein